MLRRHELWAEVLDLQRALARALHEVGECGAGCDELAAAVDSDDVETPPSSRSWVGCATRMP